VDAVIGPFRAKNVDSGPIFPAGGKTSVTRSCGARYQTLAAQDFEPVPKLSGNGHMPSTADLQNRISELEVDLRSRDEKLRLARLEVNEARNVVDQMRERIEDSDALLDTCIEVFQMYQDDDGVWMFDSRQTEIWNDYAALLEQHNKLIREWNKFVGDYNRTVAPRNTGRPIAASEAQQTQVLKLRKKEKSLRAIAAETNLTLRTVRTIVEKADGKDRASRRANEVRRKEFNRQRAAAFRSRKASREALPKQFTEARKQNAAVVKAAKGLGK
jgi:DNA-binding CsgD family transcriptional regulator